MPRSKNLILCRAQNILPQAENLRFTFHKFLFTNHNISYISFFLLFAVVKFLLQILIISSLEPHIPATLTAPLVIRSLIHVQQKGLREGQCAETGEGERAQSKIKPQREAEPERAEPICFPCPILRQLKLKTFNLELD